MYDGTIDFIDVPRLHTRALSDAPKSYLIESPLQLWSRLPQHPAHGIFLDLVDDGQLVISERMNDEANGEALRLGPWSPECRSVARRVSFLQHLLPLSLHLAYADRFAVLAGTSRMETPLLFSTRVPRVGASPSTTVQMTSAIQIANGRTTDQPAVTTMAGKSRRSICHRHENGRWRR